MRMRMRCEVGAQDFPPCLPACACLRLPGSGDQKQQGQSQLVQTQNNTRGTFSLNDKKNTRGNSSRPWLRMHMVSLILGKKHQEAASLQDLLPPRLPDKSTERDVHGCQGLGLKVLEQQPQTPK